jgi:ATP-dependent helicase/nuclease subunit B
VTEALALHPNIASIAPNIPFLDALALWWLDRPGAADPAATADGLFIVPTRRAARGLADAFLRQAQGRPLLLPRILALGAVDETPLALSGALAQAPAIPAARRLAVLSRLILALRGANGAPTEADRAWVLAGELADLLDEAARAEIDLARALPNAVAEDFAAHWNVTLQFLRIITHAWPAWLAEQGFADIAAHQIALLNAQTQAWRAAPPALPVIAAGSTGAIAAVARLLRVVAHLPAGLVVLPGLDMALDEASWDALDATHPQASLRGLLHALQATRGDVKPWSAIARAAPAPICPPARIDLWRRALLPASSLGAWQAGQLTDDDGEGEHALPRLDPADQQEEAVAIALVLRDALARPHAQAALVTPDRALARRVSAELLRFGILADDSAGENLAETPAAIFLRLLAEAVAEDLRPVPLLALLKHPLAAAGLSQAACREAARRLERDCLRGPRPGPGLDGLRARRGDATFLDRLAACLRPLLTLAETQDAAPDRALAALLEAAEALATTDTAAGATRLWAGEDGQALAAHLAALRDALPVLPPQRLTLLPHLLQATLAGPAIRTRRALRGRDGAEHPRVFIWGLLEARLQSADLIVLGGLCEGVWPPFVDAGPWMNRAMRAAVGLPSPEERIGLAAHDFVMAGCAAPVVLLSAPRRRDGAPAIQARWLVRLEALLQGSGRRLARHPAPLWARALDQPDGPPVPVGPPAPAPAVALRPRKLSVTEIETWLRDPYAIHARHILRLRKLDPLEQSADAADYGRIAHDGMHRFFGRIGAAWPADAARQLEAEMDAALDAVGMCPALAAWWRPRLRRIAAWVAETEAGRRALGRPQRLCPEIKGSWTFAAPFAPFTLHGRADRIERRADGRIAILDYKTGAPPSAKNVEDGLAPQLPLEAAMVRAGAFGDDLRGDIGELTYWHISGGYQPGKVLKLFKGDAARTEAVAETASFSLQRLVASFDDPGRAYLSQPSAGAAPRFSDYARLARVAEWAVAEE